MSRRLLILLALLLAAIMVSGCCCCCGGRKFYAPGTGPAYHVTIVPAPHVSRVNPIATPVTLPPATVTRDAESP